MKALQGRAKSIRYTYKPAARGTAPLLQDQDTKLDRRLLLNFVRVAIHIHIQTKRLLKSLPPPPILNVNRGDKKSCNPTPKFVHIRVHLGVIAEE